MLSLNRTLKGFSQSLKVGFVATAVALTMLSGAKRVL